MISPAEISYIVEWWRSGNEPRKWIEIQASVRNGYTENCTLQRRENANHPLWDHSQLNPAGCTLAKMAIALEQACETAEMSPPSYRDEAQAHRLAIETMRKNRLELLG